MKRLVIVTALLLSACAHRPEPEPRIVMQRVEVPISVPCAVESPPEGQALFTKEKLPPSPDLWGVVWQLYAEYRRLLQENRELRAANSGCKE